MIQVRGSKRIVAAQTGIFSNLVLGGKFTPKISGVYRSNFLRIGLRKIGQWVNVYPTLLERYEHGKAPELYRSV